MKSKLIFSTTVALMIVSSSAVASPQVGQAFGDDVDHLGTQCVLQQKAQADSKDGRAIDTDRDEGRAAKASSAS